MNNKFWFICVVAVMLGLSLATAATPRGGTSGGRFGAGRGAFTRNSGGAFRGGQFGHGNWNGRWRGDWHRHHNDNDFFFFGGFGFPFWGWGYPGYGYYPYSYPYGYGYYPYGYYGGGYGYGYGNGYYGGYNSGSSVVQLQRRLARAGYYHGRIDGIMGSRTRQAVRAYQRDHHTG